MRSPHKIYPSSSAWVIGGKVDTEYDSGCLRYALIAPKAPKPFFDPLFNKLGAHHEAWYAEKLGDRILHRELSLYHTVLPGVEYSGRCDFQTTDGMVHETKASFSKKFLRNVIKKGKFKKGHLAQLVSYLIELQQSRGLIAAGYYEVNEAGEFVQKAYREFQVMIADDGSILVDGTPSGYTVHQQLQHQLLTAEVLSEQVVHEERPIVAGYSSPCNYCPMSAVCDKYDAGNMSQQEFTDAGIEAIKNKKPLYAKPNKEKTNVGSRTKKST